MEGRRRVCVVRGGGVLERLHEGDSLGGARPDRLRAAVVPVLHGARLHGQNVSGSETINFRANLLDFFDFSGKISIFGELCVSMIFSQAHLLG